MRRADNIDKIVGDNLRALRLRRGMSQSSLADQIGITFQQVQKYEKGSNRISAGRLYRIAKLFNVPIASLYDGLEGVSGKGTSPAKLLTRRDATKLVEAFIQIREHTTRYALLTLTRNLAKQSTR
jgi:transcriptional regulator with XRE-family HTH domain